MKIGILFVIGGMSVITLSCAMIIRIPCIETVVAFGISTLGGISMVISGLMQKEGA